MKVSQAALLALSAAMLLPSSGFSQVSVPLPGRVINKLLPDYGRPKVYALNRANGSVPGTLLALNPTNSAILGEISVNLNPTDMAIAPAGDALYVINAGSRTISKVDLALFSVVGEKPITTPSTYSLSNPLYVVAAQSGKLYYTDGAWGPEIYFFDFDAGTNQLVLNTGGNQSYGAGGMVLNRSGNNLYIWQQYGWGAGNVNSWVTRFDTSTNGDLTPLENSFTSWRRDPLDTPLFLDGAERWVFNKQQMFAATNVSILVNQFANNIYGISLDGAIAFGPSEVFNTVNGNTLTNLSFSTTVQTLSGDQKKLFRYQASSSSIVLYDMATIASVSGPNPMPTPANGAVVSLPLTNLSWTVSPLALAYDVFFGTNQSQVAAATTGSALHLGRVTAAPQSLPAPLTPGVTYYWRLDIVGFSATNTGPVWSFTTSTLSVNPAQINYSAIAGYNPANISLSLTGAAPVAWTAAVTGSNWLLINPTSGTSPGTVTVTFNTAALAAGQYTNNITFTVGGTPLTVPVSLNVKALNITKMVADRQRPYLYAIQPPTLSGQSGLLLFINTTNGNIDKTLSIGINPVDLSINDEEGRLYIASWTETWTYVVDLQTQELLPSLNLGTDVFKINAGRQGRLVAEGMDQWVSMTLFNTTNGASLASGLVREGDGAFDPTGRYYYHVDNNSSGAAISKFDTLTNSFVGLTSNGTRGSYYGSRNLVISADGSRLFWTRVVFDADLVSYDMVPDEVYSCSTNGRVAFGTTQAYDSQTRQAIYNLPVASAVSVVDGQNQRFWYFANGTLGSVSMSAIQSPSITTQPAANSSVVTGGSVYLTVTAQGISPLSYQWTLGGTNVPAETNYFLSILNLQPSQAGPYRVVVSNPFGAVTSSVAQVNVLIPPSIVTGPVATNVAAGQSFSLSVTPGGSVPFTYRWMFENSNISGATGPVLTINNAQSANEGIYRAVVNNSVGSVTSAPVFVRVLPSAPVIVSNPASLLVGASSNATFGVQAIGSQLLTYQWLFNNTPIPGATAVQYSLNGVQAANAGSYSVAVSNTLGTTISTAAMLTVLPVAPYFTINPLGATLVAGSSRTLTALANGSQPLSYQWQQNGTNLPGASSTSLALTGITIADSGAYRLLASNVVSVSTSAVAQVTVYQNATLLTALSNQVVQAGDTVLLAVGAGGSQPLVYGWQFNGQPIPGTNSTLTLTNIQLAQSGFYRVTVSNDYGSVSSTSRVSVMSAPAAVVAWGDNSGGQSDVPPALGDLVAIAGGDYHSIGLRRNGTLLGWGYNGDGQVTVPTNSLRLVAIAAGGSHNLAITENGGVIGWGRNDYGQRTVPPSASNNVLSVAAGDAHSLALLSSGTVVAWGDNALGQSFVPQGLNGVRLIAAGHNHSLALRTNGTITGWGFNLYGQTTAPASLTNAIALAGGYLHSAALRSDGTVLCWGDGTYGQTNVPPGLSNVVAIAAGDFHTYALRSNGTIVGWGSGDYGQLGVPGSTTNSQAVSSGFFHGLALVPPLALSVQLSGGAMILRWTGDGMLQWAPTPYGPFTDMPGYNKSYTNADMTTPARFFRLRKQIGN
jgi:alpha-tubulin suppressor-like RCC1 family protein